MIEANKAYTEVKRPSVAPLPHPTIAVLSRIIFLETATVCIDNKLNVDTIYRTSGQGFRQSTARTFFCLLETAFRTFYAYRFVLSSYHYFFLVSDPVW